MLYRKLLKKRKFAQTSLRSTTTKIITHELNFMQHPSSLVTKNVSLPKVYSVNICFIFSRKVNLFKLKKKYGSTYPFFFQVDRFPYRCYGSLE